MWCCIKIVTGFFGREAVSFTKINVFFTLKHFGLKYALNFKNRYYFYNRKLVLLSELLFDIFSYENTKYQIPTMCQRPCIKPPLLVIILVCCKLRCRWVCVIILSLHKWALSSLHMVGRSSKASRTKWWELATK